MVQFRNIAIVRPPLPPFTDQQLNSKSLLDIFEYDATQFTSHFKRIENNLSVYDNLRLLPTQLEKWNAPPEKMLAFLTAPTSDRRSVLDFLFYCGSGIKISNVICNVSKRNGHKFLIDLLSTEVRPHYTQAHTLAVYHGSSVATLLATLSENDQLAILTKQYIEGESFANYFAKYDRNALLTVLSGKSDEFIIGVLKSNATFGSTGISLINREGKIVNFLKECSDTVLKFFFNHRDPCLALPSVCMCENGLGQELPGILADRSRSVVKDILVYRSSTEGSMAKQLLEKDTDILAKILTDHTDLAIDVLTSEAYRETSIAASLCEDHRKSLLPILTPLPAKIQLDILKISDPRYGNIAEGIAKFFNTQLMPVISLLPPESVVELLKTPCSRNQNLAEVILKYCEQHLVPIFNLLPRESIVELLKMPCSDNQILCEVLNQYQKKAFLTVLKLVPDPSDQRIILELINQNEKNKNGNPGKKLGL